MNAANVCELIEKTGICQVHSSCKTWRMDPTTVRGSVSYSIASGEHVFQYDVVSEHLVVRLFEKISAFGRK